MKDIKNMKIAIVIDWLCVYAGAERLLAEILKIYPQADLFSVVDFFDDKLRHHLQGKKAMVSFIQHLPLARKKFRYYLPLMPMAVERFDLSAYDLVISGSHAVAKGVLTHPSQLHFCYLLARNLKYAYEDRPFYRQGKIIDFFQDLMFTPIRTWDSVASQRPDVTVAPSRFVGEWHQHRHGVSCDVVYPPVNISLFQKYYKETKDDYYVSVCRLEPYKRMDVVVAAFNQLGKKLVIIGSGSQDAALRKMAGNNIQFLGYQNADTVAETISKAKAFVFASREDWGIAPVEAQACGTPVIAYGQSGVRESIAGLDSPSPTGILFDEQNPAAIIEAVTLFEKRRGDFLPSACRENSNRFSTENFHQGFKSAVESAVLRFQAKKNNDAPLLHLRAQ